jgi:hypothetical protein
MIFYAAVKKLPLNLLRLKNCFSPCFSGDGWAIEQIQKQLSCLE